MPTIHELMMANALEVSGLTEKPKPRVFIALAVRLDHDDYVTDWRILGLFTSEEALEAGVKDLGAILYWEESLRVQVWEANVLREQRDYQREDELTNRLRDRL